MSKRERVFCYVDGYNLYRALRDWVIKTRPEQIWSDLVILAEQFSTDKQDIKRVYYCSAPYFYDKTRQGERGQKIKESRRAQAVFCLHHRNKYARDLFRVKFGYFRKNRNEKFYFEEKQTDVNLALLALDDAHRDYYDHAFIISGDSDFIPLGNMLKKLDKKVTFIFPPTTDTKLIKDKFNTEIIEDIHIEAAQFDPGEKAPDPLEIY